MKEFHITEGLPTGSHWTITSDIVAEWPEALLNGKPVIGVDFDHTITKNCEACSSGEPVVQPGAVEVLKELHKKFAIVIWTGRGDVETVLEILTKYDIPFDDIQKKLNACFIIDDRAIWHRSWEETLRQVKERSE